MDCPSDHQLIQFLGQDDDSPHRGTGFNETNSDELIQHIESCESCQQSLERITSTESLHVHPPMLESPSVELEGMLEGLRSNSGRPVEPGWSLANYPDDIPFPVVPGYEIQRLIGFGGMGTVFYAIDEKLQREVAIKVLNRSKFEDKSALARFRTEALAIAQLNHPNIIEIYDVGQHDGDSYLALEYVAGGSLRDFRKSQELSWNESAGIIEKIARGVHFAHERGFIHRDLKPANILRCASGDLKISDFGLAKHIDQEDQLTRSGDVIGTPGYMAPEQLAGKHAQSNAATDIYALGAMLYEMICNRSLFPSESTVETLIAVRENRIVRPSAIRKGIPTELETICLKCLEKSPSRRYASANELADELRRFINRERIQAKPKSPAKKVALWCRQHPFAALVAAALVTLGPAVSVLTGNRMRRLDNTRVSDRFRAHAGERTLAIQASLVNEVDALEQVRAFFHSVGSVSRQQFSTFARSTLERHPTIAALEWAPIVSLSDRSAHERSRLDSGLSDYLIRWKNEFGQFAPAGDADEYVPVFYMEPFAPNRQALGFDLNSEPLRRQALEESRQNLKPAITRSLRLVQDASDAASVLVVLAVPKTDVDRQPRGFVVGVYRVGEIVESALGPFEPIGIHLQIFDAESDEVLWSSTEAFGEQQDLVHTEIIEFGSRRWELQFSSTRPFVVQSQSKEPTYFTWGGICVSLLSASLVVIGVRAPKNV
ncbi:MAG: CHASE domain-containing protein [Planctomycetota bacterium]